ncbi:hypothetical protein, partial [Xanthomonas euvesicatoria]|uniref:hypothetical protein n=1 Tax=Xanthomonas euvesicatoria TaxID=456327 RepID=UPI001B809C0A
AVRRDGRHDQQVARQHQLAQRPADKLISVMTILKSCQGIADTSKAYRDFGLAFRQERRRRSAALRDQRRSAH